MKVVDHEPQFWCLLEASGALFLDANCEASFVGYTYLIHLNQEEVARYRREGRSYLSWLAEQIQDSAPIMAASTSVYKGRDLSSTYGEQVNAAVKAWRKARPAAP